MTTPTWSLLVADEDADVRSVVEELLLDRGFEVYQAASAAEAAGVLREMDFDTLLCHLELLRARGGRLGREARSLRPALWIVAMSASGGLATDHEAHANLAKPFSRAQLLAAVRPAPS